MAQVKITFVGAGSTIFAKNVLGDVMLTEGLQEAHIALYDIDAERLADSQVMLQNLNRNINHNRATITAHLGTDERRTALRGATFVVNAIQVGGYDPCTLTDFDLPNRYGLRQTIGDTIGIGGLFRSLRTIPVVLDIARDMEAVCPTAWLLNYTNPMCAITAAVAQATSIRIVGLCHSVQCCVPELLKFTNLQDQYDAHALTWHIAGINHQAWLLRIEHNGQDMYPIIKEAARNRIARLRQRGDPAVWIDDFAQRLNAAIGMDGKHEASYDICARAARIYREQGADGPVSAEEVADAYTARDVVRLELMQRLGYYVTESSEHSSEYVPWFIKKNRPDLIAHYNIPLDDYPRRCRYQIYKWQEMRAGLVGDSNLHHEKSIEYGSMIMHAMVTGQPCRIAGNVVNNNLISNLPRNACVEVPCLVDRHGIQPTAIGDLPEICAALNRTNINTQLLTIEAALTQKRDAIYQAAMLDPHTGAELAIDDIVKLCDDLIDAHGDWLPTYVE